MSLQVWLPLNGSLENRGVGEITTSGTYNFANGGKLGLSYLSAGNISITIKNYNRSKVWSCCFWGYIKSASITTDWTKIVQLGDDGHNLRVECCPKNYGSGKGLTYGVFNNSKNMLINSAIASSSVYYDQWAHICLTSDGATIKRYVNGILDGTATYNGTGTLNGTVYLDNNVFIGKNDFRLYDHCLSPKEVHEIAQGLVLHYPLNNIYNTGLRNLYSGVEANGLRQGGGWGIGNTVKAIANEDGSHNYYFNYKSGTSQAWCCWDFTTFNYTPGKTYQYYIKIRVNQCTSGLSVAMRRAQRSNDNSSGGVIVVSPSTADGKWREYYTSIKITSSNASPRMELCSSAMTSTDGKSFICDFDISEVMCCESDTPVPFINNSLLSNVVSDCSGYGNDGTIYGTLSLDSNSSVYDNCTRFNGSSYIQSITNGLIPDSTNFSISCWIKSTAALGNWYRIGGLGEHTYIQLDIDTTGKPRVFIAQNGSTVALNTAMGDTNILDGNWHHICGIGTPTLLTIYVDGIQKASSSRKTIWSKTNAIAYVGTVKNGALLPGSISDFRIYSTALSAEDVKALYQQGASIDNLGSMHTYGEFNEGQEKISIGKNKVVSEGSVNEEGNKTSFHSDSTLVTKEINEE